MSAHGVLRRRIILREHMECSPYGVAKGSS